MKTTLLRFLPLVLLLGVAALAVLAQDDELENPYQGFSVMSYVISSLYWSVGYLLLYGAVLATTLVIMRIFPGFDTDFYYWIGALWIGGLIINGVVYAITRHHFLGGLLGAGLIFGWSMLLNRLSIADIPWPDAKKLALILALICAPWFGPTLRTQAIPRTPPPAVEEEATMPHGRQSVCVPAMTPMKSSGKPTTQTI